MDWVLLFVCVAADAQRSGVTAESVKAAARTRQMSLEEAEKILGINSSMSYDEVLKVRDPSRGREKICTVARVWNKEIMSNDMILDAA